MISFLYSFFGFIAAIAILVAVHEYGHFQVARKLGVKVLRFSIGFGFPIAAWRRKNDPTEYRIGLIPLGGYVKMLDEREGEVAVNERAMAFNRQSLGVRSAIVAAGPAYNFLFAIVAMWLVFIAGSDGVEPVVGRVSEDSTAHSAGFRTGDRLLGIDGREVNTWEEHQIYLMDRAMRGKAVNFAVADISGIRRDIAIDFGGFDQRTVGTRPITVLIGLSSSAPPSVVERIAVNSAASRAGLQLGDLITAIDGEPVADWNEMVEYVRERPNQRLILSVVRNGGEIQIPLTTDRVNFDGRDYGRLGLYRPSLDNARLRYGPLAAIPAALDYNWRMTSVTLRSMWRMLRAQMSAENLAGPITIARLAGHTAASGIDDFVKFLAIISISLGLVNLLPIPVLDGGHLANFAYEAIKGRPPSEKALLRGQFIGIVLLLLLMGAAFYNDIIRLF